MADRELKDLRRQIRKTHQVLEANERRRTLLQQRKRPRGMRVLGSALASGVRWVRAHPARLVAAAAVVLLGSASLVASSAMVDNEPQRSAIGALPEPDQDSPAEVTVTLSVAGSDGGDEPDGEPAGEPDAEPDGKPADESGAGQAEASGDREAEDTAGTSSEQPPTTEQDSAQSDSAPELSGTDEPDDPPATEPEPADSPEPEPADSPEPEASDDEEGACLGVNALGLTVDLCLGSLLG